MAQQMENRFAKRNQHCDVTEENRKSQNNPILVQQLLNNGISLQKICGNIPNAGIKQWPSQGNNPIFTKN